MWWQVKDGGNSMKAKIRAKVGGEKLQQKTEKK
jgi:hypothetical protein